MAKSTQMPKAETEKDNIRLYHHVYCEQFKEVTIALSPNGTAAKKQFGVIGISSKETIAAGFRAVDASPFKTVFVIREKTGEVLFALSQNEAYVAAARKKKKNPPPPPPPPPGDNLCCDRCYRNGGYACQPYPDGPCICFGADTETGGGDLDDELETLAF